MPLKGKLLSSYRKKETGNVVYRYAVSGPSDEIKKYEESVGDNLKLDDATGKPIYFATKYVSDNITIIFNSKGEAITDDTEVTKLASLVNQYGIDVARLLLMQQKSNDSNE